MQTLLVELSEKDHKFDKHKLIADSVVQLYRDSVFENYATRIFTCAQNLQFYVNQDSDLKLKQALFCHVRTCPMCQWRRSYVWQAKAHQVFPKIQEQYPNYRWLFLTLTSRNPQITDLKQSIQNTQKAFKKLILLKRWPAIGWVRSLEVTRGRDGSAHPHYHILMLVHEGYFHTNRNDYIKQSEWVQLWKDCNGFDYFPTVNVQAKDGHKVIPEMFKYITKESDFVADRDWLLEYTNQMHGVRCIGSGGVLKDQLKFLSQEPDDLVGRTDTAIPDNVLTFSFRWSGRNYFLTV